MNTKTQPRDGRNFFMRTASDGTIKEMILTLDGFLETGAYATGGLEAWSWEFDLSTIDGWIRHFAIPYTQCPELLDVFLARCAQQFVQRYERDHD